LQTPRTLRGLVRRADVVQMEYPEEVEPPSPRPEVHLEKRPFVPSHKVKPDAFEADWRAPIGQSVMWKPKSESLDRSRRLLASLHDLRRAGQESPEEATTVSTAPAEAAQTAAPPAAPPQAAAPAAVAEPEGEKEPDAAATKPGEEEQQPQEEEDDVGFVPIDRRSNNVANFQDLPLFEQTLCNLQDDAASLRNVAEQIREADGACSDCGGARHASTVIARRLLGVLDRKMELLEGVQDRLDLVEAAFARKERIVDRVCAGGEAPPEILGVAAFLKKYIHAHGEPQDANKSDFDAFVHSFGLPERHKTVVKLRDLIADFADWWTVATLKKAEGGLDVDNIMRMLDVVKSMTGGKKSEKMQEAAVAINDKIAEQVLVFAEGMVKKDEFACSRSDVPQVESARKAARDINFNIKEAIVGGCPTDHPGLVGAKKIASEFEVLTKSRIAEKAHIHAKMQLMKDDNAQQVLGPDGIVEVGLATRGAESIDDAMKKAVKEGAPKVHEHLEAAKNIASTLRERDGVRKRMKNRQERMEKEKLEKEKQEKKNKKKKKKDEDDDDDDD